MSEKTMKKKLSHDSHWNVDLKKFFFLKLLQAHNLVTVKDRVCRNIFITENLILIILCVNTFLFKIDICEDNNQNTILGYINPHN